LDATIWGAISALSLPCGALIGLVWQPGSRWISALMAFGAGALLFALTIELMSQVPGLVEAHGARVLLATIGGTIAGGLIFDLLNQLLNNRGAFLRNLSNAERYVAFRKRRRAKRMLRKLTEMDAFAPLDAHQLAEIVKDVRRREFRAGELVFDRGEPSENVYFVRRGQVEVVYDDHEDAIEEGHIFGETGVLLQQARMVSARAREDTVLYLVSDDIVTEAVAASDPVRHAMVDLALQRSSHHSGPDADKLSDALDELKEDIMPVREDDAGFEDTRRGYQVAVAIWLGISIDAIPESLIIGQMAGSAGGVSLAFIVGVFLANFPESLSSAVAMRAHGISKRRIMTMWTSLVALTAMGAAAGTLLFPEDTHGEQLYVVLTIEGLAAGAMLTAIAETMLPEAYEQGGALVGFATLCGFLVALCVAALG
jgi:CRP-like cAMP-binding protein